MSQHVFNATTQTGEAVEVLMGWDRPLQFVFCVVTPETGEEEYLYSNLDEPQQTRDEAVYVRLLQERFGIAVPPDVLEDISHDRQNNVGNRRVQH